MATSSVSAIDSEVWQLIETKTISGTNTQTFSGLGGAYKKLMLACDMTSGYSSYPCMRFNGDSGDKYAGGPTNSDGSGSSNRARDKIYLVASPIYDSQFNCVMVFNNTHGIGPKYAEAGVSNYAADISNALYLGTDPISSVTVFCSGGDNFGSGTMKLYGLVA